MHRIGGRQRGMGFGLCGAAVGIPLFGYWNSNMDL